MKAIGGLISSLVILVIVLSMIAEGLLPIGAIARVGGLRFLNMIDASRGRSTGSVEVDNAPDGFKCQLDSETGGADCEFE